MCESILDGGKRCACDTRGPAEAVFATLRENPGNLEAVGSDPQALADLRDHASTPVGAKEITEAADGFEEAGLLEHAAYLRSAARVGAGRAEADADARTMLRERKAEAARVGDQVLAEWKATPRQRRAGFLGKRTEDGRTYMMVLQEYAADPKNRKKLEEFRDELTSGSLMNRDTTSAAAIGRIITQGKEKEKEFAAEAAELRKAEARARGAERRALGLDSKYNAKAMTASAKVLEGKAESVSEMHPELAEEWHPDNPVGPDKISGRGSEMVLWRCRVCSHEWEANLHNRIRPWRRGEGRYERCPACSKRERVAKSRDFLKQAIEAYGADPEAFDRLPPAMKERILMRMGLIGNGENAFTPMAKALINGDLSMADVVRATSLDEVAERLNDSEEATDDADRELSEEDLARMSEDVPFRETTTTVERVDQILGAGRYASIVEDDKELADSIVRASIRQLWNEAHNNPDDVDAILERISSSEAGGPFGRKIGEKFAEEVAAARAMEIPEGYNSTRVNPTSRVEFEVNPFLSQKQFALLVAEQRRVANLSGTGAGKTLSALLAARHIGAEETVAFVPANLVKQWAANVRQAFPDTDVRIGVPGPGENLETSKDGRPRVWIVSYGALSSDAGKAKEALGPLAKRVDMVIMDEAHKVKTRSKAETSQRREVLDGFMTTAGRRNKELAVVGMTATPVVNDLEEAASMYRLITGKSKVPFRTEPTKKNALDAHSAMMRLGVRYVPNYLKEFDREERVIKVDKATMREVGRRYKKLTRGGRGENPSKIEQALLPAKIPALLDAVRSAQGPTLVYSHYTTGVVKPVIARLQEEGITAAAFTGDESEAERAAILAKFRRGEIQVLIGSSAISTGVDELQYSCNNLVILSPPWTAAEEEQLIGRLNRTGQLRRVKVTSLITEAEVDGKPWSWDKPRYQRIHFKRGLGDAVTDGVIPQGHAASEGTVSKDAARVLSSWFDDDDDDD